MSVSTALEVVLNNTAKQASAIFAFDTFTAQFGLPKSSVNAPVWEISTRPGSAAALVGYLSAPKASADRQPVSVLATPSALFAAADDLAALSPPTERPALVVQVACSESALDDEKLKRKPALERLLDAAAKFEQHQAGFKPTILFAGGAGQGAQEVLDIQAYAQTLAKKLNKDVVIAWDAIDAALEKTVGLEAAAAAVAPPPSSFRYFGPAAPEKVVVLPSSVYSATALAANVASSPKVGLLVVTALRPWYTEDLLAALPESAADVQVYAQDQAKLLYSDVLVAIRSARRRVRVRPFKPQPDPIDFTFDNVAQWAKVFGTQPVALPSDGTKLVVFWSADAGKSADLAARLAASFKTDVTPRLLTEFDNFSGKEFGLQRSTLLLSPKQQQGSSSQLQLPLSALAQVAPPSLLFLSGTSLLDFYSPLSTISADTQVVFSSTSWKPYEFAEKLKDSDLASLTLAGKDKVFTLDTSAVVAESGLIASDGLVEEACFWLMFLGVSISAQQATSMISELLGNSPAGGEWSTVSFSRLVDLTRAAINTVSLPEEVPQSELNNLSGHIVSNATQSNPFKDFEEPQPSVPKAWHNAAKQLLFPEAYEVDHSTMRPDLPEDNFLLTVTENRRLTPLDYDRNVFHLELSTKGTGLKYEIGEALGVHGHNDTQEVLEFLEWFGLDPEATVALPSRNDRHHGEARSVFQVFQQNLDIYGKPGKSFYEALSKLATNREEARHLRFIASAEGNSTFKKWSEIETVTYVDVLKAFPSTKERLGLEGLLREVPLIKPRHYSIASSQNFVGDSVHLLVVTVDWMTPSGESTRALSRL